tara:strand:- start:167 stop:541 length:375 start_codon:yes stop_codon:yes gene_type:complete
MADRLGKLASCSDFDPDRLSNGLKSFIEGLSRKKGAGKNLWAKQFIKSINYSIESIQINFFYFPDSPPSEKKNPEDKNHRDLKEKNTSSPIQVYSNYIPIILPNRLKPVRNPNMPHHSGEIQNI